MIEDAKSLRMFIERFAELRINQTFAGAVVSFLEDAVDESFVWWDHIPHTCIRESPSGVDPVECPFECFQVLPDQHERVCVFRDRRSPKCKLRDAVKDKKIMRVMESI